MLRAAIYARFSSDNQSDKSIEDQVALCRELCAREGFNVVAVFHDRAISGASVINRPGYQALMRAAEAKSFDVLVAEDMDRVFRDQGDYHHARKRLDHHGITIHTATGKVGKLDGALRALMGEMYIDNLRLHVIRGLEGVVRSGRRAGGMPYGYRPVLGRPGELEIVEEQAEIVRRIFKEFAQGNTARDIAGGLNADKIEPPSGLRWNASTIYGNVQRGNGILLNEIYVGQIVWNKAIAPQSGREA
jgi:site-specific DNA recombinase